ncbi:MAG TPA: hypothetical protein VNM67_11185 [Thermoanaerobaculia bacterium]|jgi:predicted O-methyltransferase YrrM|nr:hypothetical protein [Thermoanaerobaculia bacterium]
MDFKGYSFQHQGEKRDHLTFGNDFLPELERVVAAHSPNGSKYLEWGAGLSTLLLTDLASRCFGTVVSVEHNTEYADSVLSHVRHPATLQLFAVDLNGPRLSQSDTGLNYGTLPLSLGIDFDFILIDGRRRLECAYSAFVLASPPRL